MLLLYEELASGHTKPIPWKKLLPQVRGCVSEAYLPPAHLEYLTEPSSMRDNQCHTLLTFWYQRQLAGDSPVFRFHKYLVQDELVDANPRELVEAEDDDEAEVPSVSTLLKGKNRNTNPKKQRIRSDLTSSKGKGKQRESSPVMSSDSSEGEFIEVGSDVTDTSDETDDERHDLGLNTLYEDATVILKVGPPTAGPSTTRRPVEPTVQPSRNHTSSATPSTAQPATSSPPTSSTVTFTPQSQDNFGISEADLRQGIPRAAGSVIPAPNRDDRDGVRNLRPDLLLPTLTLTPRDDESQLRNHESLTPFPTDDQGCEEPEIELDIQSLQPELQHIAQSIRRHSPDVMPFIPNWPSGFQSDADLTEEPLDLHSLQPELQAIANSFPTNTSPAVRKLLRAAFQALQVETQTPSGPTPIISPEGILPQRPNDLAEMKKRSRSDSGDASPSSPTKKSRFVELPTPVLALSFPKKSFISRQKSAPSLRTLRSNGPNADMSRGPNTLSPELLSGTAHSSNVVSNMYPDIGAEGITSPREGVNSDGKKNYAEVVISSTRSPRRSRSQVLSTKMPTRVSTKRATRANPHPT